MPESVVPTGLCLLVGVSDPSPGAPGLGYSHMSLREPVNGYVCLNRLWAGRQARITFELKLELDSPNGPVAALLQGGTGRRPKRYQPARQPWVDRNWTREPRLWSEELSVRRGEDAELPTSDSNHVGAHTFARR